MSWLIVISVESLQLRVSDLSNFSNRARILERQFPRLKAPVLKRVWYRIVTHVYHGLLMLINYMKRAGLDCSAFRVDEGTLPSSSGNHYDCDSPGLSQITIQSNWYSGTWSISWWGQASICASSSCMITFASGKDWHSLLIIRWCLLITYKTIYLCNMYRSLTVTVLNLLMFTSAILVRTDSVWVFLVRPIPFKQVWYCLIEHSFLSPVFWNLAP